MAESSPIFATPIAQRIPDCPQCGYSWEGLPAAGQCPECGLRFDERSRGWSGPRFPSRTVMALLLVLAIWSVIEFTYAVAVQTTSMWKIVSESISMLLVAGVVAWAFQRWRQYPRYAPRITLLPGGLRLENLRESPDSTLPWASIRRLRVNGHIFVKSVAVMLHNGQQVDVTGPFRTSRDVYECVNAAHGYLDGDRAGETSP